MTARSFLFWIIPLSILAYAAPQLPLRPLDRAYLAHVPHDQLNLSTADLDIVSRSANLTHILFRSLQDIPATISPSTLEAISILPPQDVFPSNLDVHASYHTLESFQAIMASWVTQWPEYASISQIGHSASFEGRPITAFTVSKSNQRHPSPHKKLRFLITAGQHAREWIGPSAALFLMDQLLFAASLPERVVASEFQRALDNFEFVFVPHLNPDGYAYSWTNDRLWKKTRQQHPGSGCVGLDLNRNWGTAFSTPINNPCSENYAGAQAFDAPELKGLRDAIKNQSDPFNVFVDLHAFGQMIMCVGLVNATNSVDDVAHAHRFPFAYACDVSMPDFENLYEAAIGASKAASHVHGRPYQALQICENQERGGEAADWTYTNGIPWSFSWELRDLGNHGFLLPEHEIRPTGEEVLSALLSLTDFIILVRSRATKAISQLMTLQKEAPHRTPKEP